MFEVWPNDHSRACFQYSPLAKSDSERVGPLMKATGSSLAEGELRRFGHTTEASFWQESQLSVVICCV